MVSLALLASKASCTVAKALAPMVLPAAFDVALPKIIPVTVPLPPVPVLATMSPGTGAWPTSAEGAVTTQLLSTQSVALSNCRDSNCSIRGVKRVAAREAAIDRRDLRPPIK